MSGDARDFNNIETQAVKFYFFMQGKAPKEIHAILTETLGEHAPLCATVKVAQFKRGDFSTCDAPRPGRPKTVTTPEVIDQIHELISYACGLTVITMCVFVCVCVCVCVCVLVCVRERERTLLLCFKYWDS